MLHKQVRIALIEKDITIKELSKLIGFSRVHTSMVINGHSASPRVRKAIADALNAQEDVLWNG